MVELKLRGGATSQNEATELQARGMPCVTGVRRHAGSDEGELRLAPREGVQDRAKAEVPSDGKTPSDAMNRDPKPTHRDPNPRIQNPDVTTCVECLGLGIVVIPTSSGSRKVSCPLCHGQRVTRNDKPISIAQPNQKQKTE